MMLEGAILSILIVIVRGGISKKSDVIVIKGWYLSIIGLTLQRVPDIVALLRFQSITTITENNFLYLHILSYISILTVLILNIKMTSIKIVFAGTIFNMLAIFSNNGYMPVSGRAIETIKPLATNISDKLDYKHILLDSNTNFTFLVDIFPTPPWYPLKQIFSIGDILIAIGIFILIQNFFFITKSKEQTK